MSFIPLQDYLNIRSKKKKLPFPNHALTYYLNGGFEESRYYQIYSENTHQGKTLVVLNLCKYALQVFPEATVHFIDAEKAFTLAFIKTLSEEFKKRFFIEVTNKYEVAFKNIENIFSDKKKYPLPLVVLDSIAALATPENLTDTGLEGKMDFKFQKAAGIFFRRLNNIDFNGWFFALNQARANIRTGFVPPGADKKITPGGEAWEFYNSMKLQLTKVKALEKTDQFTIKLKTKKNKVGKEFTCFLGVDENLEFRKWGGMQEILIEKGILVEHGGGRYSLGNNPKKYFWREMEQLLHKNEEKIILRVNKV